MPMTEFHWFRYISGGYWVKSKGREWRQVSVEYYWRCQIRPDVYQTEWLEDHSHNDGIKVAFFCAVACSILVLVLREVA